MLNQKKKKFIDELNSRVEDKILNKANAEFLTKLINKADSLEEVQAIMAMGTTYKRTGFHFSFRKELSSSNIKYLKENKNLSFVSDKDSLTHKLIIGDNYDAVRQLLITHKGKIDIIYIDPPFRIKDMANAATRDGYISMLYTRLQLAINLLSEKGVIFFCCDNGHFAYMTGLLNEVFGESNFIENFIWEKNATKNFSFTTSTNHEYVLCYAKNKENIKKLNFFKHEKQGAKEVLDLLQYANDHKLSIKEAEKLLKNLYTEHPNWKGITKYSKVEKHIDSDGKEKLVAFTLGDISSMNSSGCGYIYDVIHPVTGNICKMPTRGWGCTYEKMQEKIKNNLVYFYEDATKVPRLKMFLKDVVDEVQKSCIKDFADGKKDLVSVMNDNSLFDNAKPVSITKTFLSMLDKDSVILDFFAGSGTTGEAVLELNREDGGNRKFILCTNNEVTKATPNGLAYDVTAKRLKRVMTGTCYDGSNDFNWINKNEPYGDNLEVTEIMEISPTASEKDNTPFDIIDETAYGLNRFENKEDKINWICTYFENTMRKTETDKQYCERWYN